MSIVQPYITLPEGAWFRTTTYKEHPLGTVGVSEDGRQFRYARAGGTAVAVGKLCQMPVPGANFDELALPAAVAIGAKSFNITNGATTIALGDFDDGYLVIEDDTGEGYLHKINDHDAESAGSAAFEVRLKTGIQVAMTTSTTVGLLKNPYSGFIIHPSPATAKLVGVTQAEFAANAYGWLQTRGPSVVLIQGTVVINERVADSASADGAVTPVVLTEGTPNTDAGQYTVGTTIEVAATTEHGAIWLDID